VIDPMMISQPQVVAKVLTYEAKAHLESDINLRNNLLTLHDFGFVDFERNKELLIKFEMNIETVAGVLMN
jgi:hypothetical protein